jgi:hypothetical protein
VLLKHFPDILEEKMQFNGEWEVHCFTPACLNFREKYPLIELLHSEKSNAEGAAAVSFSLKIPVNKRN